MAFHGVVQNLSDSEEEFKNSLKHMLTNPVNIETVTTQLYEELLEDIVVSLAFEVHEMNRFGGVPAMSEDNIKPFALFETNETDIFGQLYAKTSPDCCCPICNRPLSASKFAPHLGNCLGMGRNSSRIASRRIANNCKENTYGGTSDDDDDYWVAGQDKSKLNKKFEGKKKKDKNGVRKVKTIKVANDKNHSGKVPDDLNQNTKYENTEVKN